jgi:branched-chain amino acid transport system substrate-binding protein
LSGISRWIFRTISSDSSSGAALARYASRLGKRAAVLYENDSYGRGLADAFRHQFSGEVVSMDPISTSASDYTAYIAYYEQVAHPDIVFVAGVDATGRGILREAQRQGFAATFLGGDGWIGVAVDTSAAEGAYIGVPFDAGDSNSKTRAFVDAFRRKFNHEPDAYAALAYDATMMLADAAYTANGNRAGVREHLATSGERGGYDGVTGRIRFDGRGDPQDRKIVMTRVRNGALVATDLR